MSKVEIRKALFMLTLVIIYRTSYITISYTIIIISHERRLNLIGQLKISISIGVIFLGV